MGIRNRRQTWIEISCDHEGCTSETSLAAPSVTQALRWLRNLDWQISEKTSSALCKTHRTRSSEDSPLPTDTRTPPRVRAINFLIENKGVVEIEEFRKLVHPSVINFLVAQRYIDVDETHVRMGKLG